LGRGWRAPSTNSLSSQLAPRFYYPLDEHGQPLGVAPVAGRRPSKFIVPVPAARRRVAAAQDGVIAVKIINHFGDEVMKVYRV
jgi:hypothetical protein